MKWLISGSLVAVLLMIAVPLHADDDDDDAPSRLQVRDGVLGIELGSAGQALSGIRVARAEAHEHRDEHRALAEVVSLQPLLALRARHNSLRAEQRINEVQLRQARETYERLRLLHDDNANISERQLEEARAQMDSARARLAAQQVEIGSLREEAVQAWGDTLAGWALADSESPLFKRLIEHQDVILNVTLGRHVELLDDTRTVYVNPANDRRNARKAYYVSAATHTDSGLQGQTFFFRTHADKLRLGMRVHVWIPISGELMSGVYLPSRAVLRHANQLWLYLRQDDDFFYRRALQSPVRLADGWFVDDGQVEPGSEIVVRGAQMLLSEEYRWQIPDEDDDL